MSKKQNNKTNSHNTLKSRKNREATLLEHLLSPYFAWRLLAR